MKKIKCCGKELIKFETWGMIRELEDDEMLRFTIGPSEDLKGTFDLEIEEFKEKKA